MRTEAVQIQRHGGPEVMRLESISLRSPAAGEIRVRQTAIGLNFADIYQRKGAAGPHRTHHFPTTLGSQGAGVVEAVGPDVSTFRVGERIAYIHEALYARHAIIPVEKALRLPDHLSDELAAAFLVRGLTAEYLLRRLYRVGDGTSILAHAAAGGMGEVLCQWARALGATVIGTVGSKEKIDTAYSHGCHTVIHWRDENMVDAVMSKTDGKGVHVVYDAIGRDLFLTSLDCLRPRGILISYGTASGDVQNFDLQLLHANSLSVCRPTLRSFIADTQEFRLAAADFFGAIEAGHLTLKVTRNYPLTEVQRAHFDLESRATTGAAILVP